ncbi:MAG: class II aldolase/adducin family protein [Candidatus Tectomicrobia bacterium]|uniref:Class II aldolase/adducin family protein n=1 Tax=Tectimicrobiota bacterium TaxID=2528274 RepID=A0A932M0T3_UNCTE|nr:class II aldolase/adducin family protein [Candidatus Tectomicrobia bacterium]
MTTSDWKELRGKLASASRILYREGVVEGFGHISARVPGTDTFLIPRRMSPALVTEADLLLMNVRGEILEGDGLPNSESHIHSSVYKRRPDVGSVAHTHAPMATVLSNFGKPLRFLNNHACVFAEGVPLFHGVGHIDTVQIGDEMAAVMGNCGGLFLRAHGTVTAGKTVEEATILALYLEEASRLQYQCLLIGEDFTSISPEEARAIKPKVLNPTTMARGWDYYLSRL